MLDSWVDCWNVGWLLSRWIKIGGIDEEEVIFRLISIHLRKFGLAQLLPELERVSDRN